MFYPHSRPLTRAIHSLEHLAALSDVPSLPFCLSERTAYVLQNLAVLDAVDSRRYARLINPYGYVPVQEGDDEYALFQSTIDNLCLELIGGECQVPQSHIFAQQPNAEVLKKDEWNYLIFPSVVHDELGGEYDPETGVFTALEGGRYYRIGVSALLEALVWPVGKFAILGIFKSGVGEVARIYWFNSVVATSQNVYLAGSCSLFLSSPGDFFRLAIYHNLATNVALYPSSLYNNIWIDRLA